MNITLTAEQEQLIQEKLKSGKYSTVARVIDEALQLLAERDRQYEKWVEETRQKVAVGIAQIERGEALDGEVVMPQLEERSRQHFLEAANKAYTALKNNKAAWEAELEERKLWDGTLADGLDLEED